MKKYHHLTAQEKERIALMYDKGTTFTYIASIIGCSISTISREIKRNSTTIREQDYTYTTIYLGGTAHIKYLDRRKNNTNSSKFTEDVKSIIESALKEDLSFNCISKIRKKLCNEFPCTRTLYNYFKRGIIKIPKTYRLKLRKRKQSKKEQSKAKTANTKTIHQRPSYIGEKRRLGHWELDLIESAGVGGYIISFVEIVSKFAITHYIENKTSANVNEFLKKIMKEHVVHSITTDNGSEFHKLYELKSATNYLEIYYADPSSPWQKGLVENFNKLIREYIKKKDIITSKTKRKIKYTTDKINNRPKDILNFNTPLLVYDALKKA